ncbi:MAG TPA: GvpL/GvpF family gas vesicle protein [Longimicrobiaceae bacterium]|nr:GvpL/GvpF family gas vesicle protein [Longimicrobiaceae bacterium]
MESTTLTYLYGIVPEDAPEPPAELAGIEGAPVRLLRAYGVAAVVGDVADEVYAAEKLDARLADLAWVGERGVAHEIVLTWFADRGPVIPLSLFSLHQGEERITERLEQLAPRLGEILARLAGRREWGVKVRRIDATVAAHLELLSPRLRALAQEMEGAPPGRRFLLAKKRDAMRGEELRAVSADAARRVFEELEACAERSTRLPVVANAAEAERPLVLHGAFLVAEAEFPAFQQRLSDAAHRYGSLGFDFEFTGPWPAYHFADVDAA